MHTRRQRFAGDTVVVTGAASGIGLVTAVSFARDGACVTCVDLADLSGTIEAIKRAGGRAVSVQGDVSDTALSMRVRDETLGAFGPATVLVNVAGLPDLAQSPGLMDVSRERWDRVMAVNLTAPFLLAKAILPDMVVHRRGTIVNVSSLAGRLYSLSASPAYSASKAGLLGLTRHLASDYGAYGIRVNAICPGPVDTPMLRASMTGQRTDDEGSTRRRERISAVRAMTALGRVSTVDEQASVILFLASSEAAFISGVAVDTNGGFYMA